MAPTSPYDGRQDHRIIFCTAVCLWAVWELFDGEPARHPRDFGPANLRLYLVRSHLHLYGTIGNLDFPLLCAYRVRQRDKKSERGTPPN